MTRHPNLRGRYDRKVLSPLQRGLLYAIGFVLLMAFQIDQLLTASFKIEFFDHEIARVENVDRQAQTFQARQRTLSLTAIPTVAPEDWPKPPAPTSWSSPSPTVEPILIVGARPEVDRVAQ